MKFYFEGNDPDAPRVWYSTLTEAHTSEKTRWPATMRASVRIHEAEVQTDKAGVLELLRGGNLSRLTGRVWTLTSRGGLREISRSP